MYFLLSQRFPGKTGASAQSFTKLKLWHWLGLLSEAGGPLPSSLVVGKIHVLEIIAHCGLLFQSNWEEKNLELVHPLLKGSSDQAMLNSGAYSL